MRKRHTAEFKAKVAIESIKGLKTINEIAAHFEVATKTAYKSEDAELWYDTIVAYGELLSTTIISEYLNAVG
ncbi:MAG: aspartate kinase, partial [Rikenellaceae bacterium]